MSSLSDDAARRDDPVFVAHRGGKLSVSLTVPLETQEDLSIAYTPGVARVSTAIAADPALVDTYTWTSRLVAVVTDGSAVLGLGDIGPKAALPVMEGKAALFKRFAGLDAVPIALDVRDVDEMVAAVRAIAPSFGGINLEDISAPRCFELERRLDETLDIPVFHDDQHGTAIVVLAALRNAALLVDRKLSDMKIVVVGAGAAGVAVTKMLLAAGVDAASLLVCDSRGIIHRDRPDLIGPGAEKAAAKVEFARTTNLEGVSGGVEVALRGADVLISVAGGRIEEAAVAGMAPRPIVFTLANPTPEVDPEIAKRYASVVATGRSDLPNQINNVLAFPGVFQGAFAAGARRITEAMKVAAADAIARVAAEDLRPDAVVPSPLDPRVVPAVAAAVAEAATESATGAAPQPATGAAPQAA